MTLLNKENQVSLDSYIVPLMKSVRMPGRRGSKLKIHVQETDSIPSFVSVCGGKWLYYAYVALIIGKSGFPFESFRHSAHPGLRSLIRISRLTG